MSDLVIDITPENAQQILIEESRNRAVLVDFWADWCSPCKMLMPILEKLVNEYAGQVILAKVNADEQQGIAQQFGVRSLPTVVLMKDGQPVDGFMGAQPESEVRALLEKHLPKPWDQALAVAIDALQQGQPEAALEPARAAYVDSGQRSDIAKVYAQVLIELNRTDEAQVVVDSIPMVDQDADYERLVAELELRAKAADTPEIQALVSALEADPDNRDLQFDLAVQFSQVGRSREALEMLLGIIQVDRDFRDGEARRIMLDVIRALGKGDPLAAEFQRKLFALMY